MEIYTILTPNEFVDDSLKSSSSIEIVIDVLRASTTICVALYNGSNEIIPCKTIKESKIIYNKFPMDSALLCGERKGIKPMGFDYGNSPYEFSRDKVENKSIILTTTNGTKALEKSKGRDLVLIGSFVNMTSLISFIEMNKEINSLELFCAGNYGKPSLEDCICAGAIINMLIIRYENCYLSEKSRYVNNIYLECKDNLKNNVYNSEHGKKLIELGFKKDIDLALMQDFFPVIPVYRGGKILPIFPIN